MLPILACLFLAAPLCAATVDPCACPMPTITSPLPNQKLLPIPTRVQWNTESSHGYCGEMSIISAGLSLGQYMSQYTMRALGNSAGSQSTEVLVQTDPDGSAVVAATNSKLNATLHQSDQTDPNDPAGAQGFLTWMKGQILAGNTVIFGVYMNQSYFETNQQGDSTYDHIVFATGIGSNHPLNASDTTYYADDVLYFWDNGLWYLNQGDLSVPAYSSCAFGEFANSRSNANDSDGNLYSLPLRTKKNPIQDYAVSITGVNATSPLIPLSISAPICEEPSIAEGSTQQPPATAITLTITMGNPPEANVNVYKYNDLSKVPTSNFNANASQASMKWLHQNSAMTIQDTIQSNEIAIYRAVLASDP